MSKNKIIIDPKNCSREDFQELIDYLEEKCWDHSVIEKQTESLPKLKNDFEKVIDLAEDLIHQLPQKGDTSNDCQRVALQCAIDEFSYTVNGIEKKDLKDKLNNN